MFVPVVMYVKAVERQLSVEERPAKSSRSTIKEESLLFVAYITHTASMNLSLDSCHAK